GDQDPMTWLNEVEKAFTMNLFNYNQKIAIIIPYLKAQPKFLFQFYNTILYHVGENIIHPT
ncbi:5893_t:CDS:2, partial [Gigaspora rosea]